MDSHRGVDGIHAHLTAIGTFPRTAIVARCLLDLGQAARPRQWIKNLACFAGLVFSGHLFDPRAMYQSVLAFVGFCLSASAVYLLNDVVDRRLDRLNPSKRDRPIAAGRVPVSWALGASAILALAAFVSTLWLPPLCLFPLGVYLATNVASSAGFRLLKTHSTGVVMAAWCLARSTVRGLLVRGSSDLSMRSGRVTANHQYASTPVRTRAQGNNPAFCRVALEATFDALHRAAGILPIS